MASVRVVRVVDRRTEERGAIPDVIVLDNGPELTWRTPQRLTRTQATTRGPKFLMLR